LKTASLEIKPQRKKDVRESYLKELVFLCSEVLHPQAKQTRTLPPRCKTNNVQGKY
jgi:hypothetical protein